MLNTEEMEAEREKINEQYREWHKNKSFTVQDTEFTLAKLNHSFRLEVLAVYGELEAPMLMGNYNFIQDAKFKKLFAKVEDNVLLDDMQISKIPDFWENNEHLYLDFIQIAFRLIVFPFYDKKKATN